MLGVGAGIVVVMMALVSWNSKYHRSFHVDVNENRNWNILMFLCQPIFLNLRHIFEDFLLTALLSRKVNMTQNWLNTIFCGIYNFSSENGAAFSQNWLINISVRYVATIIQVSSEIPPPFIIIVQFSSFEKDHSHHSRVRSLFVLDHLLAHSCCWDSNDVTLADSEEDTNLHLNNIPMLMLRQTCIVTVVGSYYN